MKRVRKSESRGKLGFVGVGLVALLLEGSLMASNMIVEFSGARAQKSYTENFEGLTPLGPIELDGYQIAQKQKALVGSIVCMEKTKLNLYDPTVQNKPSFKCTLKLADKPVSEVEASAQPQ